MINCPVCYSDNDELEIVCKSCRGFLQTKVDNINLFETLWGLIENPSKTFKNIAIAKSADTIDSVQLLFIFGFLGGIPLCIFLILLLSAVIPFVYDLIFLLPLKLLTSGINYFKSNPSLTVINPTVHYIILYG